MNKEIIKVQKRKAVVTATKESNFNGLKVYADFSDTMSGFAFRLRSDRVEGDWCWSYESLATLQVNNRTFIMGSCYGLLPKDEIPFELVLGTLIG